MMIYFLRRIHGSKKQWVTAFTTITSIHPLKSMLYFMLRHFRGPSSQRRTKLSNPGRPPLISKPAISYSSILYQDASHRRVMNLKRTYSIYIPQKWDITRQQRMYNVLYAHLLHWDHLCLLVCLFVFSFPHLVVNKSTIKHVWERYRDQDLSFLCK